MTTLGDVGLRLPTYAFEHQPKMPKLTTTHDPYHVQTATLLELMMFQQIDQ